jgi:hypothetical protein
MDGQEKVDVLNSTAQPVEKWRARQDGLPAVGASATIGPLGSNL